MTKKNKKEMNRMLKEVEEIENELDANARALKLAETRLENRCQRPGMELCVDNVYASLCDEIKQLHYAHHQLKEKLSTTKVSYNELENNLNGLNADLNKKQHTLTTDIRALDLRQRLRDNAIQENTPENRQIMLTGLHIEI